MIEIWRQCVTTAGSSPAGGLFEYLSVGAFRAGGELREIRFTLTCTGGFLTEVYFALSATPVADAASFNAASPLIEGPTTMRHLGKPGLQWVFAQFGVDQLVLPFAVKVDTGSRWLHVAWRGAGTKEVYVLVSATVIGFARMGANGLGVENGLDR